MKGKGGGDKERGRGGGGRKGGGREAGKGKVKVEDVERKVEERTLDGGR